MALWRKNKQHQQVRQPRISEANEAYAFRRSRTMTGSLSSSVRAAAEEKSTLQSDRMKHHSLRQKRRSLSWMLLAALVGVAGLWALVGQYIFSVQAKVSFDETTKQAYEQKIDQYLASNALERFTFSLNYGRLLRFVQQDYPEVKQISLSSTSFFQPTSMAVELRRPIASWTLGTAKYYIDNEGVAFRHYNGSAPELIVEDNTGIDPSQTGAVASEKTIRFIGRLVHLLGSSGHKVEKIELPPGTSREIDLRITGKNYLVKTSVDRDPAGQATDVDNAIKFLTSRGLTPSYADVRVSSKLYYK